MPRAPKDTTAHPYDRLPFVTTYGKGKGRNFWTPKSSGDYTLDCEVGRQYAGALIPLLRDDYHLLGLITLGILKHGDNERDRGIIVGLMSELSKRLIVGQATQLRAIRAIAEDEVTRDLTT